MKNTDYIDRARPRHSLYNIYDRTAESVIGGVIIRLKNDAQASRQFTELLQADNTNVGKYPREHTLIKVGYQYDDTGEIIGVTPEIIMDGANYERDKIQHDERQLALWKEREGQVRAQMRNDNNVQQEEIN